MYMFFTNVCEVPCQNDDLVARDAVRLDRFCDDLHRLAIAVDAGRVLGVEATIISGFEKWKSLQETLMVKPALRNPSPTFLLACSRTPKLSSTAQHNSTQSLSLFLPLRQENVGFLLTSSSSITRGSHILSPKLITL